MAAPSALVLVCEECGETPHRVLSGRVSGTDVVVFQGTVKCSSCGRVRSVTVREDRPVEVPAIVSEGSKSERMTVEFGPDELVQVGARIEVDGHRLEVTAIEVGERRVPASKAANVRTIWVKRMDHMRVKFSVNKGSRTVVFNIDAAPDEEFEVGDIVDLGRQRAVIHKIRVGTRTLSRGAAPAEDIVRMYGRIVRERTSY
jgi:uncharacterized Zn finger protein